MKDHSTDKLYRVIGYCRVSTREQAETGYSIVEQKERLEKFCEARGWDLIQLYADPGYSGAKTDRPGLQQLMFDIEHESCDAVIVWKLDRLSRSLYDLLGLVRSFNAHNVDFISMSESFDTSTAFGRAVLSIMGTFAELERSTITERMTIGREARAKAGYFHGGGNAPFGYKYEHGKLIVNEAEALAVKDAFKRFVSGEGLGQVWRYLQRTYPHIRDGWKNENAAINIIKNPIYIGKVRFAGKTYDGAHQPLIDQPTWDAAQARYAQVHKINKLAQKIDNKSERLLTGIIWCAHCGARYGAASGRTVKNGEMQIYRYYKCYSRSKNHIRIVKDPNCKNKTWRVVDLEQLVAAQIIRLKYDNDYFNAATNSSNRQPIDHKITALKKRQKELSSQIRRLIDLCQIGDTDMPLQDISDRMKALQNERTTITDELEKLSSTSNQTIDLTKIRHLLDNAETILQSDDAKAKKALINALIDRIDIDGDNITISWSFSLK